MEKASKTNLYFAWKKQKEQYKFLVDNLKIMIDNCETINKDVPPWYITILIKKAKNLHNKCDICKKECDICKKECDKLQSFDVSVLGESIKISDLCKTCYMDIARKYII